MWCAIRRDAIRELEKNWFAELEDDDFLFTSEFDKARGQLLAGIDTDNSSITAVQALRYTWDLVNNNPNLTDTEKSFEDVKVTYMAQLDHSTRKIKLNDRQKVRIGSIVSFLIPNPLSQLDTMAFIRNKDMYKNYTKRTNVIRSFVRTATFLFRTGTWMQLFALMLIGAELLQNDLKSVGIEVKTGDSSWTDRACEYDMHMYYERIVDNRAIHDIQETFLELRKFFRELRPEAAEHNEAESDPEERDQRSGKKDLNLLEV